MKHSIIFALALAAASFAQRPGPGGPTPSVTEITTYLTLSATQVTQLQDIQKKEQTTIQAVAATLATRQQALQAALQKGGSSAATLGQMLLDIEALRKQVADARTASSTAALLVLNADQKNKLKSLDAAAQLAPTIHEAMALNLLSPPANAAGSGPGQGPRPFGGPGRGGFAPQDRLAPPPPPME